MPVVDMSALVDAVRARSTHLASSLHGERHRQRVAHTGAELAAAAGGDALVAVCFGLLHDAMRENDARDPGHGPRAAALVRAMGADGLLPLEATLVDALAEACELHADGHVTADPVVGCCWDADRLDLWRVGSVVDSRLLSTVEARRPERVGGAPALARAGFDWGALARLATEPSPERAFWVEAGRLLAGVYAGAQLEEVARAGVTLFVDLTEEGELEAYRVGEPARHVRFAVPDLTVAPASVIGAALDAIDAELERGGIVYVHCWGGCGRTGTLVGCWLVRHGVEPQVALDRYAAVSFGAAGRPCPETAEQRAAVHAWRPGR